MSTKLSKDTTISSNDAISEEDDESAQTNPEESEDDNKKKSGKDEINEDVEIIKENENKEESTNDEENQNECTILYGDKKIPFNWPLVEYGYQIIQAVSDYLDHFVSLKNTNPIPDDFTKQNEIEVKDSLPLVQIKEKYYGFSDLEELKHFCTDNDYELTKISFCKEDINVHDSKTFNTENCKDFDEILLIDLEELILQELIIDGKKENIKFQKKWTKKEQKHRIKKKFYGNKKFIHIKYDDNSGTVTSKVRIQDDTDEKNDFEEDITRETTVKDLLTKLNEKYKYNNLEIECAKDKNTKLIELDFDGKRLIIKNLKFVNLKINGVEGSHLVCEKSSIKEVLTHIFGDGNDQDKYLVVDNKMKRNDSLKVESIKGKKIYLFDINQKQIEIQCNSDYFKILNIPLKIGKNEIGNLTFRDIKTKIKTAGNIKRDDKEIIINYNDIKNKIKDMDKLFDVVDFTDEMLNNEKCVIQLDVSIKEVTFNFHFLIGEKDIVKEKDKDTFLTQTAKLINQKLSGLKEIFHFDKYYLYKKDEKADKYDMLNYDTNDDSFLNLDPSEAYYLEAYYNEYIKMPEKDEPMEIYFSAQDTPRNAVKKIINDMIFHVYNSEEDITDMTVDGKCRSAWDQPFIVKYKYTIINKSGKKIERVIDGKKNVLKYFADRLKVDNIERVIAKVVNKDTQKCIDIKAENNFRDIDYKNGDIIEIEKVPPLLNFYIDNDLFNKKEFVLIPYKKRKDKKDDDDDGKYSELTQAFQYRFNDDVKVVQAKDIIRKKYNIGNEIQFGNLKDDQKMKKCSESEKYKVDIFLPKYIFSFKKKDYEFKFQTNLTVNDVLEAPNFKEHIKPINENHDLVLKVGTITLQNKDKIVDFYNKEKIECIDKDPKYIFKYKNEEGNGKEEEKEKVIEIEIEIPDEMTFDDVRKNYLKEIESLKDIQLARIKFVKGEKDGKYEYFEDSDIINDKFNRKNNKIEIKLIDPEYEYNFLGKKGSKRLNKNFTVKMFVDEFEKELGEESNAYDIKLKQKGIDLGLDDNLFDKKYYKFDIVKIPLLFNFELKKNDSIHSIRFDIKPEKSTSITFRYIYENNYIGLNKDLIELVLYEKSEENHKIPLPPLERFKIYDKDGNDKGPDDKFFDIIGHNKHNKIIIKLRSPHFIFAMKSQLKQKKIKVKRGETFQDIKPKIKKAFGIEKYDLSAKIKDRKLENDTSFNEFEQNDKPGEQIFIISLENPTYEFKINEGNKFSDTHKIKINPYMTVSEAKNIVLPYISNKRIKILDGKKELDDNLALSEVTEEFIVKVNSAQVPIQMFGRETVYIEIKPKYEISDIKKKLTKKQDLKVPISLMQFGRELDDSASVNEIAISKRIPIQCYVQYTLHFQVEEILKTKFQDSKEILSNPNDFTVFNCRKLCMEKLRQDSTCTKNLTRIQLIFGENKIKKKHDDWKLFDVLNEEKVNTITVKISEDTTIARELFENPDDEYIDYLTGFSCELTLGHIRSELKNYQFILKSGNRVVYDDIPMFTVTKSIKTEIAPKENIECEFELDDNMMDIIGNNNYKKKATFPSFLVNCNDTVFDLKMILSDKLNVDIDKFDVIVKPDPDEDAPESDRYFKEFPYYNYRNGEGRILIDTQVLCTIAASKFYVAKKEAAIVNDNERYINVFCRVNGVEECREYYYDDESKVSDVLKFINIPLDDFNLKQVILYLGKILYEDEKIIDILNKNNCNNFYYLQIKDFGSIAPDSSYH